ncbi:PaaI family thioesterase [Nonomuraea aurantiaca]|uniref:PaaI family thioesterase n=1 Tax=Nonomuraea aurantiaca TaxID=2878562 RepID=UPI001CD978F7|nr:PaaI family thioesterase [Nonomuraea aurantiaca]MCA2227242.1 PaaI family thioesterase [Nonomuraea aurantiaca]
MTIDVAAGESRTAALCALAQQTRDLMDAVMGTGVEEDELVAVAAELTALTERLEATARVSSRPFDIAADGTVRHLGNAAIGAANPFAVPLVVERSASGGVRAEVSFRPLHEGPPGAVHGGITAMALDHLLGQAVAVAGLAGMTGTLTIRYRAPVPYGRPVIVTAEHTRTEGRKAWAEARVALPDGTLLAEATGIFITPTAWLNGPPIPTAPDGTGQ